MGPAPGRKHDAGPARKEFATFNANTQAVKINHCLRELNGSEDRHTFFGCFIHDECSISQQAAMMQAAHTRSTSASPAERSSQSNLSYLTVREFRLLGQPSVWGPDRGPNVQRAKRAVVSSPPTADVWLQDRCLKSQ
jgi:hypothetical protein